MQENTENDPKKSERSKTYIFCGLLSGVITKTICAPFDRIRLLYQVQPMFGQYRNTLNNVNVSCTDDVKYSGVIKTAQKILHEEGIKGLWRGNAANTIRGGICYATKFGMNDTAREYLKSSSVLQRFLNSRKRNANDKKLVESQNQIILSLIAGGSAGIVQKSLTYPLDILSVRMALGVNTTNLSKSCTYKGIVDCFRQITRTEGISGFYKGFVPTMCTGVPYVALQMAFFEFYRKKITSIVNESQNKLSIKQVTLISSIAGSSAGASALLLVFPGDTVRKRMMNNAISNECQLYKNSINCMKHILHNEGIIAFYHGLFPSILKSLPSGAIQFVMYETLKHIFNNY